MSSFELQELQKPNYVNPIPQQQLVQSSPTSRYMWLKLLGSFVIIGIIIYIIWAIHSAFSGLLNEMLNTGKTFFQALNCTLEKLNCCVNGCPGSGTPCSASQIKSIKDNSGCNVCSGCTPPCYLPSFKGGISCTEWALIGLGGLFAGLFTLLYKRLKRNATEETMDDAKKAALESSDKDPLDIVDIGEKDNILDEDDFDFFDINKSDEDAKAEIRKFTKVDPSTLKESNIPESVKKSVKKKFNLEGDALVKRCQTRLTTRKNARKSMVNHEISTNMQKLNPDNKTLNDQLKKEVQSIEDQWKSDKPTDKDKKPNENEEKDYNDSVEKDFHPEV